MELTLTLVLLIILAGFIKGFTGFGLSLVLLTVLFELEFTADQILPLLVPMFIVLDAILFFEHRKHLNLNPKENFVLHPTTLITLFLGIMLGTYLITEIQTDILKLLLAIIILVVIFFLVEKVDENRMIIPNEKQNVFFGGISGILTGLFTLNSIPTTIYLLYHQYPKEKYMAALVTFLMISNLLLVGVYLLKELFTFELLATSLIFLSITIIGFVIGSYARKLMPSNYFKSLVILLLAINSLKIIFDFFILQV